MVDEAEHLNWIASSISFRHPWLYLCDADETIPPELQDELQRVTADPGRPEVAFRLRFKNMFMGRWLRRASLYPTWVLRLFRPGRVRWERPPTRPRGWSKAVFRTTPASGFGGVAAWFEKADMTLSAGGLRGCRAVVWSG
jgi:hypothetical protein